MRWGFGWGWGWGRLRVYCLAWKSCCSTKEGRASLDRLSARGAVQAGPLQHSLLLLLLLLLLRGQTHRVPTTLRRPDRRSTRPHSPSGDMAISTLEYFVIVELRPPQRPLSLVTATATCLGGVMAARGASGAAKGGGGCVSCGVLVSHKQHIKNAAPCLRTLQGSAGRPAAAAAAAARRANPPRQLNRHHPRTVLCCRCCREHLHDNHHHPNISHQHPHLDDHQRGGQRG